MLPNKYAEIIYSSPDRLKKYLKELDDDGQIDHDANNHPYVLKLDIQPNSTYHCFIVRNGKQENFYINTRRKLVPGLNPLLSWREDGFRRIDRAGQMIAPEKKSTERARRTFEQRVSNALRNSHKLGVSYERFLSENDLARIKIIWAQQPSHISLNETVQLIAEHKWQVKMTKMRGAEPETMVRDVDAATQQQAVLMAQNGVPGAQTYNQVQATQMDSQDQPMVPTQDDNPDEDNDPNNLLMSGPGRISSVKATTESLTYPYSMILPYEYKTLLEVAAVPRVSIERKNGKYYILIPTCRDMEWFLKKLMEHKHGRTLAKEILKERN